jgi:hypothetical protein
MATAASPNITVNDLQLGCLADWLLTVFNQQHINPYTQYYRNKDKLFVYLTFALAFHLPTNSNG